MQTVEVYVYLEPCKYVFASLPNVLLSPNNTGVEDETGLFAFKAVRHI